MPGSTDKMTEERTANLAIYRRLYQIGLIVGVVKNVEELIKWISYQFVIAVLLDPAELKTKFEPMTCNYLAQCVSNTEGIEDERAGNVYGTSDRSHAIIEKQIAEGIRLTRRRQCLFGFRVRRNLKSNRTIVAGI